MANTDQQRNFSLELFIFKLLVKRNTSQKKYTKNLVMDNFYDSVYTGLSPFFLRLTSTLLADTLSLRFMWKVSCPLSWQEYEAGSKASATKPPLFFLRARHLENGDPLVLYRGRCLNDLFVTGFWTMPYSFCQKHGRALGFQVLSIFSNTLTMQSWALYDFSFLIYRKDITIIVLSTSESGFVKWKYMCKNAYKVLNKCQLMFRLCTVSFRTWQLTNGETG